MLAENTAAAPRSVPVNVGDPLNTRFPVPVAPALVTPSKVTWPVAARVPAKEALPPALRVEVAEGVWDACPPPPVINAVLVKGDAFVVQVAHPIVPVVVIVPPVIGPVVAILVTDPEPLPRQFAPVDVLQAKLPLKK